MSSSGAKNDNDKSKAQPILDIGGDGDDFGTNQDAAGNTGLDTGGTCPAYYWTVDEFLVMYDNPELYEKNLHKENKENINKIVSERLEQIQAQQDLASGKRVVCPYCKSTNTEKISTVSRAVSVSLVGAASGKIGKQWHCKQCGSNF